MLYLKVTYKIWAASDVMKGSNGASITQLRASLRPQQGTMPQAPSAWPATLGRMAICPAPASWATTPRRLSAAAPKVPDGETPVTSAHLRTLVRPQGARILLE